MIALSRLCCSSMHRKQHSLAADFVCSLSHSLLAFLPWSATSPLAALPCMRRCNPGCLVTKRKSCGEEPKCACVCGLSCGRRSPHSWRSPSSRLGVPHETATAVASFNNCSWAFGANVTAETPWLVARAVGGGGEGGGGVAQLLLPPQLALADARPGEAKLTHCSVSEVNAAIAAFESAMQQASQSSDAAELQSWAAVLTAVGSRYAAGCDTQRTNLSHFLRNRFGVTTSGCRQALLNLLQPVGVSSALLAYAQSHACGASPGSERFQKDPCCNVNQVHGDVCTSRTLAYHAPRRAVVAPEALKVQVAYHHARGLCY